MELDLQTLFSLREKCSVGEFDCEVSGHEFDGFDVVKPLRVRYEAVADNGAVQLEMCVCADIEAVCARCLLELQKEWRVESSFRITPQELQHEFLQLPFTKTGGLDLAELAYEELLMDVDHVLLCKPTCEGLCMHCGQLKETCSCKQDKQEVDPRWQALLGLLDENDSKD